MIGFFGSLEIETGMGEGEVSYTGVQFTNSRNFVFLFWRREKGWIFVLEESERKRWRKQKGSAFCLSKVEIWDLGSRFGLWHSFVKGKDSLRERERQSWDLKKFFYVFFFNIMLTWKFVVTSKVSVLYVYIDYRQIFFLEYK